MIRNLLFIGMAALFSLIVGAQSKTTSQPVVDLPQSMSPIPSPAGKWILVPECGWECSERKLWIENDVSHVRRLVRSYVRTLNVSWAPDGHLFFVNDRYLSNGANCYVFEPTSLEVTDVARLLAVGDPSALKYLKAGHSYLVAKRWVASRELLVVLYGHFEDPLGRKFTLSYRINLNGTVRRLSERPREDPQ